MKKQPVSAKQLRQQFQTASPMDRLLIKKNLFKMAKTNSDACIEALHLMGEYTDDQIAEYYKIKKMCEENDAKDAENE